MTSEQSERVRHHAEDAIEEPEQLIPGQKIRILFTEPPSPNSCFVELEDEERRSIDAGEWQKTSDGYWELVIELPTK
jgi:hypothetical protein